MKKLLIVSLCLSLLGCAAIPFISKVTPILKLGMAKEEVLKQCGPPYQAGAIKDMDGEILESYVYKERPILDRIDSPAEITTYVWFVNGKVVYFGGNPNIATENKKDVK